MINITVVACMIAVSIAASIYSPSVFAKNDFLGHFITYELLGILAVILTVTLASIANIHLSLTRLVRMAFKNKAEGMRRANDVRREINQNGWTLVILFVVACVLLFVKGWPEQKNLYIMSLVNAFGITILFTYILVLCDTYQVIFAIVSVEGNSQSEGHNGPEIKFDS
jgi:hypothetical protein